MARASYGPEAKKRSLHLFTVLLDYANDELDGNEAALDALRPQIQTYWQSKQRLVVRTKVRLLEALSTLTNTPLSSEQIKEALRRFADFLEILEDNRPNKGGSEVWHFTLKLWHKRSDRSANLRQFEQEWEQRRPQKSKQVTRNPETENTGAKNPEAVVAQFASNPPLTPAPITNYELRTPNFPWWQLCRESLETHQYERLTINPLTVTDGIRFDLHELYLPLGLIERKRQDRRETNSTSGKSVPLDESEESDAPLSLDEFLRRLQSPGNQRVAIVGEPGAGKTTLLQKIATWLLEQQALPIWISLADLQGETLETYLLHSWLKQATRKIHVPVELQEAFAQQFQQGRVWLLLDAIDEMAIDAATALTFLARQLRGWIADAHVVLTCRSNVWDSGKNALDSFTVYCNLSFSNGKGNNGDQVGQFIDRWFQHHSELGVRLQQELSDPKRKRIRDAVKNPLRLALLCRTWSLTQGMLPHTTALLYQQFIETIYDWKQDRFPTTPTQRQQLNQALGQVALRALLQPDTRFRLSHSFLHSAFAESLEYMVLALQLGWLNQVGISTTTGEKVYAFYHPTFQEYFAAQAIPNWQFFFDPAQGFPLFSSSWRGVILLWLGRTDISAADKEDLIQALITFDDRCSNFYAHRAYLLAAAGLAEFPHCSQANQILAQLLQWRFSPSFVSLGEAARSALLQTDRQHAITALEKFAPIAENPIARWQAAYTLGKTLDPGNPIAIATLTQLIHTLQNETFRLQVIESLGKIDPDSPLVLHCLEEILTSTQQENIRRRAAYSLGKIHPSHPKAIATLEQLICSTPHSSLRFRTAENLITLDPQNETALAVLEPIKQKPERTSQKYRSSRQVIQTDDQLAERLEQRLMTVTDPATQRRIAYRLALLQPGHPAAIDCLLQLLLSKDHPTLYKRVVEDLKEVLLDHQLANTVTQLSPLFTERSLSSPSNLATQLHECHKLLWYCAQQMSYPDFSHAWFDSVF